MGLTLLLPVLATALSVLVWFVAMGGLFSMERKGKLRKAVVKIHKSLLGL